MDEGLETDKNGGADVYGTLKKVGAVFRFKSPECESQKGPGTSLGPFFNLQTSSFSTLRVGHGQRRQETPRCER